jgi:hypothetical protein
MGWVVPVSYFGGGKRFSVLHARPVWPWGSPSLLYSVYRVSFPRVQRPWCCSDNLPIPFSVCMSCYEGTFQSFRSLRQVCTPPKASSLTMWSSASSFKVQCSLFSLRSSTSCLPLLPRLYVTSSLYLSPNIVFKKAVPTQDVTNPVSLSPFYCL